MNSMTVDEFLKNPVQTVVGAVDGNVSKVSLGNGYAAVIIDETEFTMLTQALELCMEHPEWTMAS